MRDFYAPSCRPSMPASPFVVFYKPGAPRLQANPRGWPSFAPEPLPFTRSYLFVAIAFVAGMLLGGAL